MNPSLSPLILERSIKDFAKVFGFSWISHGFDMKQRHEERFHMKFSRRDLLKISAVGAVGLAVPIGRGVSAGTASRLSSSLMPVPYRQQFIRPMVLQPTRPYTGDLAPGAPLYEVTQQAGTVTWLRNGQPTNVFGYNGSVP